MTKLILGVGVNDANYQVSKRIGANKFWRCPFYAKWNDMLKRAYSHKVQQRQPAYIGTTVCKEWHTFSKFRQWMLTQDWEGKDLDKDLIVEGNKIYSPDLCVFVNHAINTFITDKGRANGECMVGVTWRERSKKFQARCSNPFTGKQENLGLFCSEIDAHIAWKSRKRELAFHLADLQSDERIAQALRVRYEL
ncbi:MAG: hypothetical protein GY928_36510 [Colwellia sp.]|nr:hypothetical protein [Colwellia sp.]